MVYVGDDAEVPDVGNRDLREAVMAELENGLGAGGLAEHLVEAVTAGEGGFGEVEDGFGVRVERGGRQEGGGGPGLGALGCGGGCG